MHSFWRHLKDCFVSAQREKVVVVRARADWIPLDSCLFSSLRTLACPNHKPDRFEMVVRGSVVTVDNDRFNGLS